MVEDFERCYRAVHSKDPRFDGWFFTAVTSTGVYCRPSCPALTPKPSNVRFYPTAAAAQQAGFRACKRCRPDASPGSPEWNLRADVVARAMRLIADGVVDREGVPGLSRRLGYSTRQLERLLSGEVGAGPVALARAQRAQSARLLIETTQLGFSDVAFAAGFSSIRQFNDTVRAVFAVTPTELRERGRRRSPAGPDGPTPLAGPGLGSAAPGPGGALTLRLPLRLPFVPDNLFGHLGATAVPGCEEIRGAWYRRSLDLVHGPGVVGLRPMADHVLCRLRLTDLRDLTSAIARCRRLLDLDADPEAVADALGATPGLGELVAKAPGRRVPRTADETEMALRAVIGQQISTAAARAHAARLVGAHGRPIEDPDGGLTHLFPSAARLAEIDPATVAGPAARARTLGILAAALASGRIDVGPGADRDRARRELAGIRGIGPWTVEVIAMRAVGDPDAFPVSDLGVRRGARVVGLDPAPAALLAQAEAWRPWRSYAVQYLWSTLDHPINRLPTPVGRPLEREIA